MINIYSKKGYRVTSNRTECVTYANIRTMYDLIHDQMVETGIVVCLPEIQWYYVDREGQYLPDRENYVGLKVKI